jgi:hypothetical protein
LPFSWPTLQAETQKKHIGHAAGPVKVAEEAKQTTVEGRGSHFDPDIVDAFVAINERSRDITMRFSDAASA